MQDWREQAAQIVRRTVTEENLSVEEAAARFAVRPTRIRRILVGNAARFRSARSILVGKLPAGAAAAPTSVGRRR